MLEYRPWTWKVPDESKMMSRAITRQDAYEGISGEAVFTRDVNPPEMLYAKILMSPYAHAKIISISNSFNSGRLAYIGVHPQLIRISHRFRSEALWSCMYARNTAIKNAVILTVCRSTRPYLVR